MSYELSPSLWIASYISGMPVFDWKDHKLKDKSQAEDLNPNAVSKASELASVDAERDLIPYGLCYRFKLPYFP